MKTKAIYIVLLLLPFCSVMCSGPPPLPEQELSERPNIVLISIDTWRADHFTPALMPRFFKFAEQNALIFERAYSNSTWTTPSHVTMLTGLLPSEHRAEYENSVIPENVTMVQEQLKERGYTTLASTGRGFVRAASGFDRGFDVWKERQVVELGKAHTSEFYLEIESKPFETAKKIIADISDKSSPVFLFVHTFLVHDYIVYLNKTGGSDKENQRRYKTVVEHLDKILMQFVEYLISSPLGDNLVIIITSDHGEGFGEKYGDFVSAGHHQPPFPDQCRIPLIVYGSERGKNDGLISLAEITPMILSLADEKKLGLQPRDFIISEVLVVNGKRRAIGVISDQSHFVWDYNGEPYLFIKESFVDSRANAQTLEITEEDRKDLKALGYL